MVGKNGISAFAIIVLAGITMLCSGKAIGQTGAWDSLALTPPMGWNSWNFFEGKVSEKVIMDMADAMVGNGMKDAGYNYLVIDDLWTAGRDSLNRLIPEPKRFPHGMKYVADYVHAKGLKLGLYSDAAARTCGGAIGSLGFEDLDATTFAGWGIDFLKYDYCNAPGDVTTAFTRYKRMSDALKKAGRPMVFSICEWGQRKPWLWAKAAGGQLWRTTWDGRDVWRSNDANLTGMMEIFEQQKGLEAYAGPGGWNDPDLLMTGLRGKGSSSSVDGRFKGCTNAEYRTQFALWCMLAAPLMLNADLTTVDPWTLDLVKNAWLVGIDQDRLGKQASVVYGENGLEVLEKPLSGGKIALCILNKDAGERVFRLSLNQDLGIWKPCLAYSVWEQQELGRLALLEGKLAGHDCAVYILTPDYATYPMWNPALPFVQRVDDLVSRLTLEEKVAQMMNTAPAIPRLGIPAYEWWNEILHGVARTPYKTTVFPQAIGMAATWDTASLRQTARDAALEGRAINHLAVAEGKTGDRYKGLTYWTPNINIFRDPRWGRGQETYGEDPFLTGQLGYAFVKGLQGDDSCYLLAAACAKHYAVHSGPEASRHTDDIHPSRYDLWDTYLPAFRELVVHAGVAGVMCAYNSLNAEPCCANDLLMTDILRNQWGFKGYVTSDCGAIEDFYRNHKTHKDALSAAVDGVVHGTDVECGNAAYKTLVDAVKRGVTPESQIDTCVRRLFMIRMRLGMFDPPSKVPHALEPMSQLESPEHAALALRMARESIVLLKNEGGLLPLRRDLRTIAVVGPNADKKNVMLANYNGTPSHIVSVLEGIRGKVDARTQVIYEQGVDYTTGRPGSMDSVVEKVSGADVIVFVGGISSALEGEEMPVHVEGFSGGDRTSILLPKVQTELEKRLQATGKPVVFVLLTGSAIAIPWEQEHIPAIVNAWYGGQSGGAAVADVLFGDYNPAGRLPVTFYKSDADLPDFKDYSMKNRTYRYFSGEPLYPFGYGLSYTAFEYSDLRAPGAWKTGTPLTVEVTVSNTGKMDGEEVVQLYVSHPHFTGEAPRRSLQGFQRVFIKHGEHKTIPFLLRPEQLMLVDGQGNSFTPGGHVLISVGGGQPGVALPGTAKVLEQTIKVQH